MTTPTATPTPTAVGTRTVRLAIRATPAEVWAALTDSAVTPAYYVGFEAHFDLSPGAPYRYTAGGGDMITGEVVAVDPGERLVTTFRGLWDPAVAALPQSTVTFEISDTVMPLPGVTLLTCRHDGLADDHVADHLEFGWVSILSGLKTLLETGRPLAV